MMQHDGQTENQNNLYVRNLPESFSQTDLEELFNPFGLISTAKVNDNGVAFVRYDWHVSTEQMLFFTYIFLNRTNKNQNTINNKQTQHRFARFEDAAKAMNALNETRPNEDFEENMVVKLAHYDIGDIRNRFSWNKSNDQGYYSRGNSDNSMYEVCRYDF